MGPQFHQEITEKFRKERPLRTLLSLFRPETGNLLLSLVFGSIKQSPQFVTPMVTGAVITIVSDPGPDWAAQLIRYAVFLSIILLQNVPNEYLRERFLTRAIRNVEAALRSSLVRRLQELSISFHDTFATGRLHSKILRDADAVVLMTHQLMKEVALAVISLLIIVGITMYRDPGIALFFLVAVPPAVFLVRLFRGRVQQTNEQLRLAVESMSALVAEIVALVPITRAHALEHREVKRMDSELKHVRDKGMKLDILNALFNACAWVTFQFAQFSCLLFTAYLAIKGKLAVGDVVIYQSFFTMVIGRVSLFLSMYPQIAKGLESVRSMGDILECPDLELNEGKRKVTDVQGEIRFEAVDLVYPDTELPAVAGFSCHVGPGECIAFVGESGSGKSSVMSLIMGFRRPTAGRILLDGCDMTELDLRTFRNRLAVVPQETILFSGTLRENITYGLDDVPEETVRDIIGRANLSNMVDRLPDGLETMIGENGAKLSGGQRQRVAIARALIRDPRVIILDEATSALDVASEQQVQSAINGLIAGRTTFIVAHRLSTIRNADRIVVMDGGRQIEVGTHQELLEKKGMFYRYASLQGAPV